MIKRLAPILLVLFVLAGCDDPVDQSEADVGADVADDAEVDGDTGGELEGLLRRPVEVFYDEQGMPHIYAETLEDLFFVNGYVQARDRLGQMEFYRRVSTGKLSEVFGAFDDGVVGVDTMFRMLGLGRAAEAYWAQNYDPENESHIALESFSAGVNAFVDAWREGDEEIHSSIAQIFIENGFDEWTPVDSLAIGRLLAVELTYYTPVYLEMTILRERLLETFPPDSDDPAIAARSGVFQDVVRFSPSADATHIEGFPNALVDQVRGPRIGEDLLMNGLNWHRGIEAVPGVIESFDPFHRNSDFLPGSNNWVVSGDYTDSGYPQVANDPHLGLQLPTVFYPMNLVLEDDLDGRADLRVQGAAYVGAPGIVIGRTPHMAWGTTVGFYDYVDLYHEEITDHDDGAATVRFNDEDVAIETVIEEIGIGQFGNVSDTVDYTVEIVPHHGPLIPESDGNIPVERQGSQAISVKWVGLEANNDFDFLIRLWRAEDVDDVREALTYYSVGSSNFVFGFTDGDIYYSGRSNIPVRSEGALTFHPRHNIEGNAPAFVLPGDGSAEWEGFLADEHIPHAHNPEKGYVITANNDPVGVTLDNEPVGAEHYLGVFFDIGFRAERIEERIQEFIDEGRPMTVEDHIEIQDDPYDGVAARTVPHIVDAVDTVLDTSISDDLAPDLASIRAEIAGDEEILQQLRDLLAGWDFKAPGTREPTGDDVLRSSAAALLNVTLVYAMQNVFGDEMNRLGYYEDGEWSIPQGGQVLPRALIYLLDEPEDAVSYDPDVGDSLFFDDLDNEEVTETRYTMLVRSLLQARDRLANASEFGRRFERTIPGPQSTNPDDWVWGNLHGLSLRGFFPVIESSFNRPGSGLPFYERPGGTHTISPCGNGYRHFNFTCGGGASLRMVHDLNADDPVTYNALPGGASENPNNPHFDDQIERWNQADPYRLIDDRAQMESTAVRHEVFD